MAFRSVSLSADLPGKLYLHSMPGRYEVLQTTWAETKRLGIAMIVCLAPIEEIERKSPDYANALAANSIPCKITHFPIADYSAPEDDRDFWFAAKSVADSLRQGQNILVHCGAGIGRTGTFAIGVLLALGVELPEACRIVNDAGSSPERSSQDEALRRLEGFQEQ